MYWICQYNDGTEINSNEHKYKDVDRSKLEKFILLHNDKPLVVLNLDQNKRLIVRRRTAITLQQKSETVWIVGYQWTDGKNYQMICFVFPDGTVEITDGFKENHKWLYPVTFRPEEL